jgi:hypothetical protein
MPGTALGDQVHLMFDVTGSVGIAPGRVGESSIENPASSIRKRVWMAIPNSEFRIRIFRYNPLAAAAAATSASEDLLT